MNRNRHSLILFLAGPGLLAACASPMPAPAPLAVTTEITVTDPVPTELSPAAPAAEPPEVLEAGDPYAPIVVIRRRRPPDRRPLDLGEAVGGLAGIPGRGTYFARATGEDYEPDFLLGEGPLTPWGRYRLEVNPYIGRDLPRREMKRAIQTLEMRGQVPCDLGQDFSTPGGRGAWDL
jgi:hypothetical protein